MNKVTENGGIPRSDTKRRRSATGRNDSAQLGSNSVRDSVASNPNSLELGTALLPAALLSGTFTCRRRGKEEKKKRKIFFLGFFRV